MKPHNENNLKMYRVKVGDIIDIEMMGEIYNDISFIGYKNNIKYILEDSECEKGDSYIIAMPGIDDDKSCLWGTWNPNKTLFTGQTDGGCEVSIRYLRECDIKSGGKRVIKT